VAEELASQRNVPLVRVQHHYAHVVACMAENDVAKPVIGVSFDGTGYGEDGTIWGGEVLLSDYRGFTRLGHVAPFVQAGGDVSAREGWRIALALLRDASANDQEALIKAVDLGICSESEGKIVLAMMARGINCVRSTSAGRLFDAACALLGIRRSSSFEGEAATQLQFAAERCPEDRRPERVLEPGIELEDREDAFVLATDRLFAQLVERRTSGESPEELAYAFHLGLSELVEAACLRARTVTGVTTVALTGGCYQNLLLLRLSKERLERQGLTVLTHSLVPPNDGGVALGQAVVAAQWLRNQRTAAGTSQVAND
jgi:hydrogenase maturation protein HypF